MAASPPTQTSSLNKEEGDRQEIDDVEKIYQKYREVVTTLPKVRGWGGKHLYLYQGFWRLPMGLPGTMYVQHHFKARPTDVLLVSTPKSGTTWLKAIIFSIMRRNYYNISTHPLVTTNPHDCVPFLEWNLFRAPPIANIESLPSPRLFATHIPYTMLPESILSSNCRIVYICRDPKDVFISMWHFMAKFNDKEVPPLSLEQAFDLFCRGISPSGPFWDHVLGYWKASLKQPHKFLFLRYEDMKRETMVQVKRMAEFLDKPFSVEEESKGVVQQIIELCSFDNLSNLEANKNGVRHNLINVENKAFFRKGVTGDWVNHLTPQMIESIDNITKEKLDGVF